MSVLSVFSTFFLIKRYKSLKCSTLGAITIGLIRAKKSTPQQDMDELLLKSKKLFKPPKHFTIEYI